VRLTPYWLFIVAAASITISWGLGVGIVWLWVINPVLGGTAIVVAAIGIILGAVTSIRRELAKEAARNISSRPDT